MPHQDIASFILASNHLMQQQMDARHDVQISMILAFVVRIDLSKTVKIVLSIFHPLKTITQALGHFAMDVYLVEH